MYDKEAAIRFCNAIQTIAEKPANMANLESYLIQHFTVWLEKYANTPAGISEELQAFAEMEI